MNMKLKDSGFASSWMLGFVAIILFMGVFFFELGSIYIERQKLVDTADRAAAAGATAIDEDQLIATGNIVLDADEANIRCTQSLNSSIEDAFSDGGSELIIEPGVCAAEPGVMVVNAKAELEFGPVFRILGFPNRTFEIQAQARPSCSDDQSLSADC